MSPTLSTLVGDLVGETADGVHAASLAAARRRAALADGLGRDPTDDDVDDALAELFPPLRSAPVGLLARVLDDERLDASVSKWRPGETAVRAGEPYVHPELAGDATVAEFPPVERELGVSILETVQRGDGVGRLTEKSVAVVRRAVRDRLVAERRTVAAAFADGVPTPVVESTTVEAKAAFGGGAEGIEASLSGDGVRPELLGSVRADLRFVSRPLDADPTGGGETGDRRSGPGRPDRPTPERPDVSNRRRRDDRGRRR